jgi:hypothetical protein
VIAVPDAEKLVTLADFTTLMALDVGVDVPTLPGATAGIVSEDVAVTTGPVGGVPVAVPVLLSEPLVTSVEVVV